MYCKSCGMELRDGVKFCRYCGFSQLDPAAPAVPVPERNAPGQEAQDIRAFMAAAQPAAPEDAAGDPEVQGETLAQRSVRPSSEDREMDREKIIRWAIVGISILVLAVTIGVVLAVLFRSPKEPLLEEQIPAPSQASPLPTYSPSSAPVTELPEMPAQVTDGAVVIPESREQEILDAYARTYQIYYDWVLSRNGPETTVNETDPTTGVRVQDGASFRALLESAFVPRYSGAYLKKLGIQDTDRTLRLPSRGAVDPNLDLTVLEPAVEILSASDEFCRVFVSWQDPAGNQHQFRLDGSKMNGRWVFDDLTPEVAAGAYGGFGSYHAPTTSPAVNTPVKSSDAPVVVTPTPRPTATPKPSATPKPTATPRPTVTPSSRPTASPSPSPTVEPSPSASVEPSPSPTAVPSPSPSPTAEPSPSPSAEPSPSPSPSAEPSPSPTAEPSPSPSPSAEPSPSPSVEPSPSPSPSAEPSPAPVQHPYAEVVESTLAAAGDSGWGSLADRDGDGRNELFQIYRQGDRYYCLVHTVTDGGTVQEIFRKSFGTDSGLRPTAMYVVGSEDNIILRLDDGSQTIYEGYSLSRDGAESEKLDGLELPPVMDSDWTVLGYQESAYGESLSDLLEYLSELTPN